MKENEKIYLESFTLEIKGTEDDLDDFTIDYLRMVDELLKNHPNIELD